MSAEDLAGLRSIAVGLGELRLSGDPQDVLVAYGLGSCIAVGMSDPVARLGGLLHALLPERNGSGDPTPAKYVDSGIAQLLAELAWAGAERTRLIVRLAGGANMLQVAPSLAQAFTIGDRNVVEAQATLASLHFKIRAQEVGGTIGRTVRLYVADGRMTVRVMGQQERVI